MNPDVAQFLAFVQTLPLELDYEVMEFGYPNPVLILADAVLSINRRYKSFVEPRIRLLEASGITSLNQLDRIITEQGLDGFAVVWSYKHPARVVMLKNPAQKFMTMSESYGLTELETLRRWGAESSLEQWRTFGVSGIGFTTYQYLRMLCGAKTVKPDVHIQRVFKQAIGVNRSLDRIVAVIEEVAGMMKVPPQQLDHALWRYYSQK